MLVRPAQLVVLPPHNVDFLATAEKKDNLGLLMMNRLNVMPADVLSPKGNTNRCQYENLRGKPLRMNPARNPESEDRSTKHTKDDGGVQPVLHGQENVVVRLGRVLQEAGEEEHREPRYDNQGAKN